MNVIIVSSSLPELFWYLEANTKSKLEFLSNSNMPDSSNGLNDQKYQSINGSVKDALRLGCSAVGFTIYPGSEYQYDMIEEFKEISREASEYGLPSVLWSYPRGGKFQKKEKLH